MILEYMAYAQTLPLNNHSVGLIYISVSPSPHLDEPTFCKRTGKALISMCIFAASLNIYCSTRQKVLNPMCWRKQVDST